MRNRTTFVYDAAGQKTVQIDPLSRRTTSAYDAAGRQDLRIDARGNRTTYAYDADDQLLSRAYPDATRATFSYDAVGNRTTMQDANGVFTYTYDNLNQTNTVFNPAGKNITYAGVSV